MSGVIFGGKFLAEIDMTCAELCRRCLYDSENCSEIYTHKIESLEFVAPATLGDIVKIYADIVELKKKAMVVEFRAYTERRGTGENVKVAYGKLVFVSHQDGQIQPHGLILEKQPQTANPE